MIFTDSAAFSRKVYEVLTEDELISLERLLVMTPDAGDLIPGSKGLRKIRVASGGKGKRGGSRVIYYWYVIPEKIQPSQPLQSRSPTNPHRTRSMKKSEIKEITREVHAVERGEVAPARVREVTILPGGAMRRVELDPQTYRRKQARAWKAKTEAAKVRHELDLTQQDFATMLGVSPATIRKWERGTGEPSGAAKTLLAVARLHPEVIREAVVGGKCFQ